MLNLLKTKVLLCYRYNGFDSVLPADRAQTKCLGLILTEGCLFGEHFSQFALKLISTVSPGNDFCEIWENVASRLSRIIRSVTLHGAPVWMMALITQSRAVSLARTSGALRGLCRLDPYVVTIKYLRRGCGNRYREIRQWRGVTC